MEICVMQTVAWSDAYTMLPLVLCNNPNDSDYIVELSWYKESRKIGGWSQSFHLQHTTHI